MLRIRFVCFKIVSFCEYDNEHLGCVKVANFRSWCAITLFTPNNSVSWSYICVCVCIYIIFNMTANGLSPGGSGYYACT